jgi:beta-1,4-mannosyltransferase
MLRVGSWPGYGADHNAFIRIFLDALAAAGCAITSLDTVEDIGRQRDLDVILLHWAERVFWESPDRLTLLRKSWRLPGLLDRRAPGTRVVWLVHNLEPHDMRPLQRLVWGPYTRRLARRVDAILTLSPGTLAPVRATFAALVGKPAIFAWHPAYPDVASDGIVRAARRQTHGWIGSERVLGYCGQIRHYKGVDQLAEAFLAAGDPNLRLLIAGKPYRADALVAQLEAAAARDPRIRLDLRDLPDAAFRDAIGCCDVIVAPFRQYLHSGSLIYALSADRPVLTPATPFAESLRDALGPGWVRTYAGALTAEVLKAGALPPPAGRPPMEAFAPEVVGARIAAWMRGLCASPTTIAASRGRG